MSFFDDQLPIKIPIDKLNSSKASWCKMLVNKDKANFIFTIKNYSLLNLKNKEFIKSSKFSMENNKDMKWYIELYPEGKCEATSDYVSLFIFKDFNEKSKEEVKASYYMCILDKNNHNLEVKNVSTFSKPVGSGKFPGWGSSTLIKKKDLFAKKETLLPDDTLTIICSVSVAADVTQETKFLEQNCLSSVKKKFKSDSSFYENLYTDDFFSDAVLIVKDKVIKVHKCLLSAASSVFESHFKKDINSKEINVTDTSFEIMHELIRFVYTKKVENIHDIADKLIIAADKYAIQELKNICEVALSGIISIDNVLKIIAIADDSNAEQLKKYAIEFIIKNKKVLRSKPHFEEVFDIRPHLYKLMFLSD